MNSPVVLVESINHDFWLVREQVMHSTLICGQRQRVILDAITLSLDFRERQLRVSFSRTGSSSRRLHSATSASFLSGSAGKFQFSETDLDEIKTGKPFCC